MFQHFNTSTFRHFNISTFRNFNTAHPLLSVAYAYASIALGKDSTLAQHIRSLVKEQKSRSVFAGGAPQSLVYSPQSLPSGGGGLRGQGQSNDALRELLTRRLVSLDQAQALLQAVTRAENVLRSDDLLTGILHDNLNNQHNQSNDHHHNENNHNQNHNSHGRQPASIGAASAASGVNGVGGVNGASGVNGVGGVNSTPHRGKLKNVRVEYAMAKTRETRATKKQQQQQQQHNPQKFLMHSVGLHSDLSRTVLQNNSLMMTTDQDKGQDRDKSKDKSKDKSENENEKYNDRNDHRYEDDDHNDGAEGEAALIQQLQLSAAAAAATATTSLYNSYHSSKELGQGRGLPCCQAPERTTRRHAARGASSARTCQGRG